MRQRNLLQLSNTLTAGAVLTIASAGFVPATATAAPCDSAATVVSDLWSEHEDIVKQTGPGDKAEIVDKMINRWNDLAGNSWAKIGPRMLEFGSTQKGTIRSKGTRVFVSPHPVYGEIDLTIEKVGMRGKTYVEACKFPEGLDSGEEIWSFTIDPGGQNVGKQWSRTFDNVDSHIVAVKFAGQSWAKGMEYQLSASTAGSTNTKRSGSTAVSHSIIIDGTAASGRTKYTIEGGGTLNQMKGNFAGHNVSIQGNDKVSGNHAEGYVANGIDGYAVSGEFPDILLENPDNAAVYVDGKEYHSIVIDGSAGSGSTKYTISGGGDLEQVKGILADHKVTIQGNDNVSGNSAEGYVAGGEDGLRVFGSVPNVNLANPQAAVVYIDGQQK
ncbi:hypothetical protein FHR95_001962 [Halomonas fontilapidosi]|uniref:Uncharacterized protein n=1 Tax=Halomonas fontilapidosi TaxID=616675 RepID=A0A7W5GZP1_9GAMM|nr:hypothetical protein [Halomonas fontilapidosi]MBB3184401.1 hypothetical protein [Halomonas fontilapidosi]